MPGLVSSSSDSDDEGFEQSFDGNTSAGSDDDSDGDESLDGRYTCVGCLSRRGDGADLIWRGREGAFGCIPHHGAVGLCCSSDALAVLPPCVLTRYEDDGATVTIATCTTSAEQGDDPIGDGKLAVIAPLDIWVFGGIRYPEYFPLFLARCPEIFCANWVCVTSRPGMRTTETWAAPPVPMW